MCKMPFVKFDIYFLGLPKEIFFGVITERGGTSADRLITSLALQKCKKECNMF